MKVKTLQGVKRFISPNNVKTVYQNGLNEDQTIIELKNGTHVKVMGNVESFINKY